MRSLVDLKHAGGDLSNDFAIDGGVETSGELRMVKSDKKEELGDVRGNRPRRRLTRP